MPFTGSNKKIDREEGPRQINHFFVDIQGREVTSSTKKLMIGISPSVPVSPEWGSLRDPIGTMPSSVLL